MTARHAHPIAEKAPSSRPRPRGVGQNSKALPLPHERDEKCDEKAGMTSPEPQPVIEQAYQDIEAGLVDTDLHATPGLDAGRRRELLEQKKR